jgi:hypothetical protein
LADKYASSGGRVFISGDAAHQNMFVSFAERFPKFGY